MEFDDLVSESFGQWENGRLAIDDAIRIFHALRLRDVHWSRAVQSGRADWDAVTVRKIHAGYQRWMNGAELIRLQIVATWKYMKVEQGEEFMHCYRTAHSILLVSVESLVQSHDDVKAGRVVPLERAIERTEANEADADMADIMNAPVLMGLVAQGHIPVIENMLADGKGWGEIGHAIGWDPGTAEKHYRWHREVR